MKTIRPTFASVLLIAALSTAVSCEKMNFNDYDAKGEEGPNLVLKVVMTDNKQMTRTDGSKCWTRLNFAIYQGGKKVRGINQTDGDDGYGQAELTLEEGVYQVLVLAHSSDGNPTMTTPEKVQFTNAMGFTDTFCYYGDITVTSVRQTHSITLNRVTAMLRFIINDEMPPSVTSLKFYYTGGSGALNATTGLGCVDSKQTVIIAVEPKTISKPYTFDLYTIPREPAASLNLTVTAYDETQAIVREHTFKNVEVQTNKITEFSGEFFTDDTPPEENGTPDNNEETAGNAIFMISANTDWAGTISHTY